MLTLTVNLHCRNFSEESDASLKVPEDREEDKLIENKQEVKEYNHNIPRIKTPKSVRDKTQAMH